MRPDNKWAPRRQRLEKLTAAGWSSQQIADQLKKLYHDQSITKSAVIAACRRLKITLSPNAIVWTDERLDLLKRLWAEGIATPKIADAANELPGVLVTVKSVTSARARYGLPKREVERRVFPPRKQGPMPEPNPSMAALNDLAPDACRFPIGDPGHKDFGFCGHPARGSYCEHHRSVVYQKPTPEQRQPRPQSRLEVFIKSVHRA